MRAGLFVETSPFCVSFDGTEFPSTFLASLMFTVDPSLPFNGADEPDNWSTDAKLKLKVGVVSVTVKQHQDDRLQDSQSMLDLQMVKCNVVSAHSRDDALECFSVKDAFRQDCHSVGFGNETSMSPRSESQIGLSFFTLTLTTLVSCCTETSLHPIWNDKRSPAHLNGRASGALHHRAGDVRGRHGVPWKQISHKRTQRSVSNRYRKPCSTHRGCSCQTIREESTHDRLVADIKHVDHWCKG